MTDYNIVKFPPSDNKPSFMATVEVPRHDLLFTCVKKGKVTKLNSSTTVTVDIGGIEYSDVPIWIHTDRGARESVFTTEEKSPKDYFKDAALMFPFPAGVVTSAGTTVDPLVLVAFNKEKDEPLAVIQVLQSVCKVFQKNGDKDVCDPFPTYHVVGYFKVVGKQIVDSDDETGARWMLYDFNDDKFLQVPTLSSVDAEPTLPWRDASKGKSTDAFYFNNYVARGYSISQSVFTIINKKFRGDYAFNGGGCYNDAGVLNSPGCSKTVSTDQSGTYLYWTYYNGIYTFDCNGSSDTYDAAQIIAECPPGSFHAGTKFVVSRTDTYTTSSPVKAFLANYAYGGSSFFGSSYPKTMRVYEGGGIGSPTWNDYFIGDSGSISFTNGLTFSVTSAMYSNQHADTTMLYTEDHCDYTYGVNLPGKIVSQLTSASLSVTISLTYAGITQTETFTFNGSFSSYLKQQPNSSNIFYNATSSALVYRQVPFFMTTDNSNLIFKFAYGGFIPLFYKGTSVFTDAYGSATSVSVETVRTNFSKLGIVGSDALIKSTSFIDNLTENILNLDWTDDEFPGYTSGDAWSTTPLGYRISGFIIRTLGIYIIPYDPREGLLRGLS